MQATGIVRRIDDLGRVVIPREVREKARIEVGDPLELYLGPNKEVIFQKYSPIKELDANIYQAIARTLKKEIHAECVVITDLDKIITKEGAMPSGRTKDRILNEVYDLIIQGIPQDNFEFYSDVTCQYIHPFAEAGAIAVFGKEVTPVSKTVVEMYANLLAEMLRDY